MQGLKRKVVHAVAFEMLAVTFVTLALMLVFDAQAGHSGALAVISSAVALLWNMVYNFAFEAWERRQVVKGRSLARRAAHAIGFEGGLVVLLVPLFAWWLDITLWQALVTDIGFVVFFLVYGLVFNWGFDRLFGLPLSAQPSA